MIKELLTSLTNGRPFTLLAFFSILLNCTILFLFRESKDDSVIYVFILIAILGFIFSLIGIFRKEPFDWFRILTIILTSILLLFSIIMSIVIYYEHKVNLQFEKFDKDFNCSEFEIKNSIDSIHHIFNEDVFKKENRHKYQTVTGSMTLFNDDTIIINKEKYPASENELYILSPKFLRSLPPEFTYNKYKAKNSEVTIEICGGPSDQDYFFKEH